MSADNRYAEYLRAEGRAAMAAAEALRLSPHFHSGNEHRRAELIASYEHMADEYVRMAASHEQQEVE